MIARGVVLVQCLSEPWHQLDWQFTSLITVLVDWCKKNWPIDHVSVCLVINTLISCWHWIRGTLEYTGWARQKAMKSVMWLVLSVAVTALRHSPHAPGPRPHCHGLKPVSDTCGQTPRTMQIKGGNTDQVDAVPRNRDVPVKAEG